MTSDLAVPATVPVALRHLGALFDVTNGMGASVGQLSSLLGEELLISLVEHWLASGGAQVVRLPERPIRDDEQFGGSYPRPKVRDLDAWLRVDTVLRPVEAKMRTAASLGQPSRRLSEEQRAQKLWDDLVKQMTADDWDAENKVLLPLRRPESASPGDVVGVPIIAFWWPMTASSLKVFSGAVSATTVVQQSLVPATVEVFSASLYVRRLLEQDSHAELHLRGEAIRTTVALLHRLGCVNPIDSRS